MLPFHLAAAGGEAITFTTSRRPFSAPLRNINTEGTGGKIKLLVEFNLVLVEGSRENAPFQRAFLLLSETE